MRRLLALSFAAIFAASGCAMCASPYDYSGPVPNDGYGGPPPGAAVVPQGVPQGVPQEQVVPGPTSGQQPQYYEQTPSTTVPPGAAGPQSSAGRQPRAVAARPPAGSRW